MEHFLKIQFVSHLEIHLLCFPPPRRGRKGGLEASRILALEASHPWDYLLPTPCRTACLPRGRHLVRVGQSRRGVSIPKEGGPTPEGREGDHGETPKGSPVGKCGKVLILIWQIQNNVQTRDEKQTKIRKGGKRVWKKSPFLSVSSPASGAGARPRLPHVVRPHHSAVKTDTEIHRTRALLRRSSAHRGDRSCSSSFGWACSPQNTGEGTLPGSVITWAWGPSRRLAFSEVAVCPPAQARPAGTMSSQQARHISQKLGCPGRGRPPPSLSKPSPCTMCWKKQGASHPPCPGEGPCPGHRTAVCTNSSARMGRAGVTRSPEEAVAGRGRSLGSDPGPRGWRGGSSLSR